MKEQECKECGGRMKLTSTMNSGNATYQTWTCPSCGTKQQACIGINVS